MERYELAQSEEERDLERERVINYFLEKGWSLTKIMHLFDTKHVPESKFGLENYFIRLTDEEDKVRDAAFEKRKSLIYKYHELASKIAPLLDEEDEIWKDLQTLNEEICKIEGHRLSSTSEAEFDDDGYGRTYTVGYTRKCLVCGETIASNNESFYKLINYKDVVVKGESDRPSRVFSLRKKNK